MQVTTIKASVSLSKNLGGDWKRLELGLEATVDPDEDWKACQRRLYAELTSEFKVIWSGGAPAGADGEENG